MTTAAKPYGDPNRARVMLVGHDPRLQKSDTVASYCLFADYYFRPKPTRGPEAAKYGLAASAFGMVTSLTGGMVMPEQVLVTNLCNRALPHAPKGKTVLIPHDEAERGISEISELLDGGAVHVILAMSLQVNYWLQALGFCTANLDFVAAAEPQKAGVVADQPFYQPRRSRAFTLVCGKRHAGPGGVPVFPVLHAKNWPLRGRFKDAYGEAHELCSVAVQAELREDRPASEQEREL